MFAYLLFLLPPFISCDRVDYYNRRADDQLSYLSDMWALHITNTGFKWSKVSHATRYAV